MRKILALVIALVCACASVAEAQSLAPSYPQVQQPDSFATGTINALNAAITMPTAGMSGVVFQLTGTWTGTIVLEGSVDGTNYTALPMSAFGTVVPTVLTSVTANGLYRANGATLSSIRVRFSAYTSGTATVMLKGGNGSGPIIADPTSPASCTGSKVISVAAAGTSQLVALAAGKTVYVCGFSVNVVNVKTTDTTFSFVYGTGSNCGTGTTALTGAYQPSAGSTVNGGAGSVGTSFQTAVANALCITVVGTTPNVQGFLEYVQF